MADELGEYISALSNSAAIVGRKYAYFVWGIDDKTHEIVGTSFNCNQDVRNEPLKHYLARQLSPDINFVILIVAYEKPLTAVEIAKALGIPAAYIESALKKLISSELMRTIGNRYATDFRIRTPEALERCLDAQIALTEEIYPNLLALIHEYLESIRSLAFVGEFADGKRKKLEYYFILHLFSEALYRVGKRIFPAEEVFPERPDGGSWIAFGNQYSADFDFADARFARYSWAGERRISWENIYNARRLELHIYDTQPELDSYSNGPVPMDDGELAKLLYLIQTGISAQTTGFNALLLENLPHLIECGVLSGDEKHPDVALPIMRSEEYALLEQIRIQHTQKMANFFEPHLRKYLPKLKLEIPKHLEGRVAEFRKYIWDSIPMVFMKKAIEEKDFDAENATPPMVFVVDEKIDEDCPETTPERAVKFRRVNPRRLVEA